MIREILFRGKTNSNKWIYGFILMDKDTTPAMHFWQGDGVDKRLEWRFVKEETIGQYANYNDFKSNKLFEGDIVKDITNEHFVIYFDNYLKAFLLKSLKDGKNYSFNDCREGMIEINLVGNIHDNPELLKGE